MPIYMTVVYNPSHNTYAYDTIVLELEQAVNRIINFKDNCSIIVYEYNNTIEMFNTMLAKYQLYKTVAGKNVTENEKPKPLNCVYYNEESINNNVILFSSY
jgi:hypothetical protein